MRAREAEERARMAEIEAARPSKYTRGGRMTKTPISFEQFGPPMPEQFGPPMPPATFGNVPMPPLRPHGIGGTAAGPVEVKVAPVEVTAHADSKISISISAPPGVNATVTNQATVTRPGVGRSMPGAASGGGGKIDGYL